MASSQESSKMEEDGGRVVEGRPIHCINNCGFFGSVATMNLCSKCYRELNAKANTTSTFPTQTLTVAPVPAPAADLNTQPPPSFLPIKSNCPNLPNSPQDSGATSKVAGTSTAGLAEPAFSPIKSNCPYLPHSTHNSSATLEVAGTSAATWVEPEAEMAETLSRKRSNRCYSCNKRVGLTGFTCRCGDMFCALHRYSDMHACTFDYKAAGRLAISKANPLVKAPKIDKI